MAKRRKPSTRMPLERMVYTDSQIRRGQYPNVGVLADYFEVNERTIYRDIDYMRTILDYPIEFSEERKGYYYSGPAPTLPNIVLTEGELFSVFIAQKVLGQYRGTPYEKALRSAFRKIKESLSDEVELYLDEREGKITFSAGGSPAVEPEVFSVLQEALHCGFTVRMLYYTPSRDEENWREVDPYFLFNVEGDWYLLGFCHLREQLRTFVPNRIREIQLTEKVFTPPDFELSDYLRDSLRMEVTNGGLPKTVRIKFSPVLARYVRERDWHSSQAIEELEDGGLILRLTVSSERELIRWVLSYGPDAEVQGIVEEMGKSYGIPRR
jgi:predicted DNA-binding transcriptional regulator YafY